MERKDLIKKVHDAFKANETVEKFHVTKDGMAFILEHDAKNQERMLGAHDKGIEIITRASVAKFMEDKSGAAGGKSGKKVAPTGSGTGDANVATGDDTTGTAANVGDANDSGNNATDASGANEGGQADEAKAAKPTPKKAPKKATKRAPKKGGAKK